MRASCDNGYLVYIRASVNDGASHIRGECCAEMKKGVAYIVEVHVAKDGSVVEGQCECAAGIGPHAVLQTSCCCRFICYS